MLKSFCCNGEEIFIDFSKIASNGTGVFLESCGTKIFCDLVIGSESNLPFKDLSVNVVERYGIAGKIPNNYKKKDFGSDLSAILSKTIDRALRPMIKNDLANGVKFTCYVLNYTGYSIESLAVLAASLLFNIARISSSYFSLFKVTNNGINQKNSFSDKFRMYHAISSNSSLFLDFENLDDSVDTDSILNAYDISLSLAKDIDIFQKTLLQSLNFQSNYFYTFKTCENKRDVKQIADKFFDAIENCDEKNISKFNQLLFNQDYYFNHLVTESVKQNFAHNLNNRLINIDESVHEYVNDYSLITKFVNNKVFTTFVKGNMNDAQYVDSAFGCYKNNFIVQFHEGSNMDDMSGSSRHELINAMFLKHSLYLFLNKNEVIRVSCDVLSDFGQALACSVRSIAKFFNKNLKSFVIGMNASKKDKLFFIRNKYEKQFCFDMCGSISGDKDVISAIQIDCSRIFFSSENFSKFLNFYFSQVLEKGKVKFNIEKNFKINVNQKNQSAVKNKFNFFKGDDYLSGFDIEQEDIEKENALTLKQSDNKKSEKSCKDAVTIFNIVPDKIGLIIGKQGKMVKKIAYDFKVQIDVDQIGKVSVKSKNINNNVKAMQYIINLVSDRE